MIAKQLIDVIKDNPEDKLVVMDRHGNEFEICAIHGDGNVIIINVATAIELEEARQRVEEAIKNGNGLVV